MARFILLALAVGLLLGGGCGYHLGASVASGDCAKRRAAAQDAAVERERATAVARTEENRDFAAGSTAAKVAEVSRRVDLEKDITRVARKPAPAPGAAVVDCGWDGESVRLLNAAVDAINADPAPAAGGVPGAMPADASPDGRRGADGAPLGE